VLARLRAIRTYDHFSLLKSSLGGRIGGGCVAAHSSRRHFDGYQSPLWFFSHIATASAHRADV
jgi:hypothetical protein